MNQLSTPLVIANCRHLGQKSSSGARTFTNRSCIALMLSPLGEDSSCNTFASAMACSHAWLYAPPFRLIDVSLRCQPYEVGYDQLLPPVIMAESVLKADSEPVDLIDPDDWIYFRKVLNGKLTMDNIWRYLVGAQGHELHQEEGCCEVPLPRCLIRYTPVGISMMDGGLEKAKQLCLAGDYPADLYRIFKEG